MTSTTSMTVPSGGDGETALLDRVDERQALDDLVAAVASGVGRACVVHGEAGMGKTRLLQYMVGAAQGLRSVWIAGVEAERDLGYAGLHRLLRPFLDRLVELPGPQRAALGSAFGLHDEGPADRFLVGLACLTLLTGATEAAADQGLLCVIDDAQWIDEESLAALAFVGRRLSADRIGLLFGVRDGVGATDALGGLPTIAVDGLPEDAALDLLSTRTDVEVDAGLAQRIVAATSGCPLALLELASDLTDDQLRGGRVVPEPFPIGERLEEHFLRQVRALDEPAQRFALIVAADTSGDAALVRQVAADLATTTDPVADVGAAEDAAVAARLLTLHPELAFRHPLIRSAVYGGAPPDLRRSVHTALAARIDRATEPDRRAQQLAAAARGPDESSPPSSSRPRREPASAAATARNRRFCCSRPSSRRHLRTAPGALRAPRPPCSTPGCPTGPRPCSTRPDRASTILSSPPRPPGSRAACRCRWPGRRRRPRSWWPRPGCSPAARPDPGPHHAGRVDRHRARWPSSSRWARRSKRSDAWRWPRRGRALAGPSCPTCSSTAWPRCSPATTPRPCRSCGRRSPGPARAMSPTPRWPRVPLRCRRLQRAVGRRGLRAVVPPRRAGGAEHGALIALQVTMLALAKHETRAGRFAAADNRYDEAVEVTRAIGGFVPFYELIRVDLNAWRGLEDETRRAAGKLAEAATAIGSGGAVAVAQLALGTLELGTSRYADALAVLRPLADRHTPGSSGLALPLAIEAAVRSGERELAERWARCSTGGPVQLGPRGDSG